VTLRASVHCAKPTRGAWVIMNHGFMSHRLGPDYLYVGLARTLADAGVSTVRFDFAGSGESDGAFAAMTVSSMVEDCRSAIQRVSERYAPHSLTLFGHSLGGCVAALVAGSEPIDALALLAPVAYPMNHVARYEQSLTRKANERGLHEIGPYEMSYAFVTDLAGVDPLEGLRARYRGPLFLARCEHDEQIPAEETEAYRTAAPQAPAALTECMLPDADHRVSTVHARRLLAQRMLAWMKERALCD
jgi:pimeloyl-ACP methyl ester carboxylesterase